MEIGDKDWRLEMDIGDGYWRWSEQEKELVETLPSDGVTGQWR